MFNAREEMKQMDRFDLTVVNDDFQQAYQQLEQSVISFMDQHEGGLWQKRP